MSSPYRRSYLLLILLAALLAAVACAPTPTPAPAPTRTPAASATPGRTVPPTPAVATAAPMDAWERIKSSGMLLVGTSADYAPFEYINDQFSFDGFDVAVINEVGKRLGLGVKIQNFAFEGLDNALQLDQVDVAIAAISVTPKRQSIADFSDVYWMGNDAVLASDASKITEVGTLNDLGDYRVGVQRASVYETLLTNELVEKQKMSARDLYTYVKIDKAIGDLQDGRIDLVMLDAQAAKSATGQSKVKIVGGGFDPQQYAIAMRQNSGLLRTQLNAAILEMLADGTMSRLAAKYLQVEPANVLPVPTPQPTPTGVPAATQAPPAPTTCVDGMSYVSDLTYDDKNMTAPPVVPPGQPFVKAWRIRNSGSCNWDKSYSLQYQSGNSPLASMGGVPTYITRGVPSSGTYDIQVPMVAPLQPGVYQGFWEMHNGNGVPFGQTVYVGITVPAPPTPTPAATQPPAPGISFTVDRTQIRQGECVTFSWNVSNAQAVYFYSDGENWQQSGVAGQGSSVECPSQTTTYNLRIVQQNGQVVVQEITIYVQPGQGAPTVTRFTVSPSQVVLGQCLTIEWTVQGTVSNVNITRNNSSLWNGAPTQGNMQDCPPSPGAVAYAVVASGPGGTARGDRTVQVVTTNVTPTPVPTSPPAPAPPIIEGFMVDPTQAQPGQCIQISWSTGGGTEYTRGLRNNVIVLDHGPLSGQAQDCISTPGTVTYRLEAFNSAGQSVSREQQVYVQVPPTSGPSAPEIRSFTVSPGEIAVNQCVALSWTYTTDNLASAQISRNGQIINPVPPSQGSMQDCPNQAGEAQYVLSLTATTGMNVSQVQRVNVIAAVPAPLPAAQAAPLPAASPQ